MARITATPGRFCEAIVTTNSGNARLMAALRLNTGAVNAGTASSNVTAPQAICPFSATHTTAATSVAGTA